MGVLLARTSVHHADQKRASDQDMEHKTFCFSIMYLIFKYNNEMIAVCQVNRQYIYNHLFFV